MAGHKKKKLAAFAISLLAALALALLAAGGPLYAGQQPDPGASAVTEDEKADVEVLKDEDEATLFPITDYSGDLLSRPALTGDWGGVRTTIAKKHGLQFVVDVNQYYQGITSGGLDDNGDWDYGGSSDYRIKFDSGKSGLWPGGFLEVHGESYWGDTINNFTGGLLPANFDLALPGLAGTGTYLSHVIFTQFLSEQFAIIGGKFDTSTGDSNEYAHGVGDQQFMNAAFNLNPVTYLTSPYSTLGGGFIYLFGPDKQNLFNMMIYDGEGTVGTSGFDTIDDGRTTVAVDSRIMTNFFGKKGHQLIGFLYGFGDDAYQPQGLDPRLALPPISAPPGTELEDSTWAVFYNFDQQLLSDPNNPGRDVGVFGRIGFADQDTSAIESFWSIGLGGKGLFPSRTSDRFGLGYYYMTFNDDRIRLILPEDDEQGLELFYNLAVTPWFELSGNLQVIDGGLAGADTAVVAGIRARIVF